MSYDVANSSYNLRAWLKGHQIIGELRHRYSFNLALATNWKVTRSLVSYDHFYLSFFIYPLLLKGHQIIGELRPAFKDSEHTLQLKGHQIIGELRLRRANFGSMTSIERSPDHWWVTTMFSRTTIGSYMIERSPDHWWVTTVVVVLLVVMMILKGHQIIGELRHSHLL